MQANIPGPGTYGKGGVPWAMMESKSRKSMCMTGMMEGGTGRSWDSFKDKVQIHLILSIEMYMYNI